MLHCYMFVFYILVDGQPSTRSGISLTTIFSGTHRQALYTGRKDKKAWYEPSLRYLRTNEETFRQPVLVE
jgi:hypothetical protein